MAYNKVVYGGTTLIDLTEDTVTAETLVKGYTAHDKSGSAIVGTAEIGDTAIKLTNVTIPTTAWAADSTYEDCPYAATISVPGATENSYPSVNFDEGFKYSYNLAYSCKSITNGVTIYSSVIPTEDIVAATVICI